MMALLNIVWVVVTGHHSLRGHIIIQIFILFRSLSWVYGSDEYPVKVACIICCGSAWKFRNHTKLPAKVT